MICFCVLIIIVFVFLVIVSGYFVIQLKFSFDFEQFFLEGDEDFIFFCDFIDNFEVDDNFMFVVFVCKEGVFDSVFFYKVYCFIFDVCKVFYVEEIQLFMKFSYLFKMFFVVMIILVIYCNDFSCYEVDK